MAVIKSTVVLDDKYSSKAEEITASTKAMGSAMDQIKSTANSMNSALKSAFRGKHEVKISEIGSKEARSKIKDLQKNLNEINNGKYKVKVETGTLRGNGFDAIKKGLDSIKSKAASVQSGLNKFKVNTQSLLKAKKDARDLSRELTKATGKKHKIKIDIDKPNTEGFISNIKSKLSSGFSKLNPMNRFSKDKGDTGGGMSGIGMMGAVVGGNLISGAIGQVVGGIKSAVDSTLGSGFDRLQSMEASQARLRGFGFDQSQIKGITTSATNAVTGTQYGLGDAMTAASGAIAAGIKDTEIEKYLKEVGNAAAATGSDFNDVASIMNKVKTTGHLQADEMRQLSDRGLPVLAKLAEKAGVSAGEMSDRISKGLVSFDEFREAVKDASGNAAEEVSKTFGGAKDNFKSALGKIGAGILSGSDKEDGSAGGLFGMITPALLGANDVLNTKFVPMAKKAGDKLGELVTGGIDTAKQGFTKVGEFLAPVSDKVKDQFTKITTKAGEAFAPLGDKFGEMGGKVGDVFGTVFESVRDMFGSGLDLGGDVISGIIDGVANGLTVAADVINNYLLPAFQTVADFIQGNVVPVVQEVISWIQANVLPALTEFGDMIVANVLPVLQSLGEWVTGTVLPALQQMGERIQANVLPALEQLGAWIMDTVLPAFSDLGAWIMDSLLPAFSDLAVWIIDNVLPALTDLATFVIGEVIPVFVTIAEIVGGAVATAFDVLVGIVDAVTSAFDRLVEAVGIAADVLSGIGDAIGGAIDGAINRLTGGKKNATGTSYFGGGMTQINERGEEMIQLARGDKIYPAGKTEKIIKDDVKSRDNKTVQSSNSIIINVNGANKTNKDVAAVISDELKRLGVVV